MPHELRRFRNRFMCAVGLLGGLVLATMMGCSDSKSFVPYTEDITPRGDFPALAGCVVYEVHVRKWEAFTIARCSAAATETMTQEMRSGKRRWTENRITVEDSEETFKKAAALKRMRQLEDEIKARNAELETLKDSK